MRIFRLLFIISRPYVEGCRLKTNTDARMCGLVLVIFFTLIKDLHYHPTVFDTNMEVVQSCQAESHGAKCVEEPRILTRSRGSQRNLQNVAEKTEKGVILIVSRLNMANHLVLFEFVCLSLCV